jgi:hypothetical protein
MFLKPFSEFTAKSGRTVCDSVTKYREELKRADNGAADHNPVQDVLEIAYDNTSLTAKLLPNREFETRYQGAEGVSINIVEEECGFNYSHLTTITSVSRSPQGTYSGSRTQAYSSSLNAVSTANLDKEEAEFLFNLRDPGLKSDPRKLENGVRPT